MKKVLVLSFLLCGFSVFAADAKKFEMQKKTGFVGYVEAGTQVEIKTVNLDSQTLNVFSSSDPEVGDMQVSFKSFERALGNNKKVEYLNKVEPLAGKTFTLKHNLILAPIK